MFKQYSRKGLSEMTPWTPDVDMKSVSISGVDLENGSPRVGDMIARNPKNHDDLWLVAKMYFEDNLQEVLSDFMPLSKSGKCMNFGQAIHYMKEGYKVARSGWNGKGMFLFLVPGSNFKVNRAPLLGIYPEGTEINYQPHVDMKTADDTIVPWLASQSDILAIDWEIIHES